MAIRNNLSNLSLIRLGNKHKTKDVLFRSVFGNDKKALLELYNQLNGSDYTDPHKLEIVTIQDAFFITYKNDVAFMVSGVISLYEHQSTVNPNMPVRFMIYLSEEYQKLIELTKRSLYGETLIPLPTPKFVVFYNGKKTVPDMQELYISDAYVNKDITPDLQLKVTVLNINYGHNKELMDGCKTLDEYAHFVSILRENATHYDDLDIAINTTIDYCIKNDILSNFLKKKKSEVFGMILRDFDKKKYEYTLREEGREEGRMEARTELLIAQIHDGEITIESAARRLNITPEQFEEKYLEGR